MDTGAILAIVFGSLFGVLLVAMTLREMYDCNQRRHLSQIAILAHSDFQNIPLHELIRELASRDYNENALPLPYKHRLQLARARWWERGKVRRDPNVFETESCDSVSTHDFV